MEYFKKHQFQDLPTIMDNKKAPVVDLQKEYVSITEEASRQQGILHDINNLERMLLLGEMALNDFSSFEKMMAMPTILEPENIEV